MNRKVTLGRLAGLQLTAAPSALIGTLVIWLLWIAVAVWWFGASWLPALAVGLLAALLHWLSDLVHQFGHAWAAQRTGYPMVGIHCWAVLTTSIYPKNEPDLPGRVHIRRALGGPLFSLGLSVIGAAWVWLARDAQPLWQWLAWFFFLENFVIMTLQVFLPLGFNDGATIYYWLGKRESAPSPPADSD
jgi:hypothetical protein